MKSLVSILCLLVLGCARAQAPSVAISGVTVVDVRDGSLRPDRTVLVAGNRITAVGPADQVRPPDDADRVDAAGGFLIPGLWDMHVHSVLNVMDANAIANAEWHFPLFLAYGVTGVRNMNDATADVTLELSKSVRRRLAEGELRGPPRFLTAGPALDGDPPLTSKKVVVRTAAEARCGSSSRSFGRSFLSNSKTCDSFTRPGSCCWRGRTSGCRCRFPASACTWSSRGWSRPVSPPPEALQTATLNPARVLDMADSTGTVEPGKLADLVLLDASPIEDIRNAQKIRAVLANGRHYRRADLDQLLAGSKR